MVQNDIRIEINGLNSVNSKCSVRRQTKLFKIQCLVELVYTSFHPYSRHYSKFTSKKKCENFSQEQKSYLQSNS